MAKKMGGSTAYQGAEIPGVPPAPARISSLKQVDFDFVQRKRKLAHLIPFLSMEQILEDDQPYNVSVLKDLVTTGYDDVAKEINQILREEHQRRRPVTCFDDVKNRYVKKYKKPTLVEQKSKFLMIVEKLIYAKDACANNDWWLAAELRKELGQKLAEEGEDWLPVYLFQSAFKYTQKIEITDQKHKLEAELHCMLAFLSRTSGLEDENTVREPLKHLYICRTLCKNKPWRVKPNLVTICIHNPLSLLGIREDRECIEANSKTIYNLACLIEHEVLLRLCDAFTDPSQNNSKEKTLAYVEKILQKAVKLSLQVDDETIISDSLLRFGLLQMEKMEYAEAQDTFNTLYNHAVTVSNLTTQAIACYELGKVSQERCEITSALEYYNEQREVTEMKPHVPDIRALSLREMGLLLLQEGQLLESEEVFKISQLKNEKLPVEDQPYMTEELKDEVWAMSAIAEGMGIWPRFAVTSRRGDLGDVHTLIKWKTFRTPLRLFVTPAPVNEEVAPLAFYYDTIRIADSGKRKWQIAEEEAEAARKAWVFDSQHKVELSPPLSPRELMRLESKKRKYKQQKSSMDQYTKQVWDGSGSFDDAMWKKFAPALYRKIQEGRRKQQAARRERRKRNKASMETVSSSDSGSTSFSGSGTGSEEFEGDGSYQNLTSQYSVSPSGSYFTQIVD